MNQKEKTVLLLGLIVVLLATVALTLMDESRDSQERSLRNTYLTEGSKEKYDFRDRASGVPTNRYAEGYNHDNDRISSKKKDRDHYDCLLLKNLK